MFQLKHIRFVLFALSLALMCSCTGGAGSDFHEFASGDWAYPDTVVLRPVHPSDTVPPRRTGCLKVAVTHNNNYGWSNLWLEVTTSGGHRDTVEMELADPYGHWLGQGFGLSYQREVVLPGARSLSATDSVMVRHIMRVDTLRDIERVGVTFEP